MSGNAILDAALALAAHGYSVLPVKADGSKAPATPEWKTFMRHIPTPEQLHTWFDGTTHGLGIVQGAVSGNAELTEIEGRAAHHLTDLRQLAHDTGLGDLWDAITRGWAEQSPSGGWHFHYRVEGTVPGNIKIARRPSTDDELAAWIAAETERAHDLPPADQVKRLEKLATITRGEQVPQVLAETRGEGGQVVAAPTPGTHHQSGRPWVLVLGGPATAATITLEQRGMFHAILASLDQMPAPEPVTYVERAPRTPGDGITPGDDFEARTSWTDILIPNGWTLDRTLGRTSYWVRPGKTRGQGISATTGHADDRDRLYVFTSSTDFEQEVPYTKFGAHAVLNYGGDHSAAATALAADGYGHRAEAPRSVPDTFFDDLLTAPPSTLQVTEPSTYTETDDGNALRLIDTHGAHIRYCPQRGSWLTWDGSRWRWDEAGLVTELARDIARALPQSDKTATKHRLASLASRGINATHGLARTDQRTVTHLNQLDAQPYELNTPGGVVNLKAGALTPPDPRSLHTRSTTVAPDAAIVPVRWLAFLADTFAGDPAMTTYMQRLLGVSLCGTVLEQLLPFAFGPGANGKTTLLGAVQRIIGIGDDGYSISAPAEMLLATHQQGHPTEIARLSGARMVVTSELEDGQRFAEARIKQLTGRDVISGRFMRQDWFSFVPTHTMWLLANHQPTVRAGGPAFWRRLRLLPFEHTVPPELRVADLEDRLVYDEGPGILAWLVQGAADYFAHGLATPSAVLAATDAYAGDQDTVSQFVEDRCDVGDPNAQHMHVKTSDLRQAYETWCRAEGEEPVTAKALTTTLKAKFGVQASRDMHARSYDGIRLVDVSLPDGGDPGDRGQWQPQTGW